MTQRVTWTPIHSVGHDVFDAQHKRLLALCNQLADHCQDADGSPDERRFDATFDTIKSLVREHLETEAILLGHRDEDPAEDLDAAREEFEYVVNEIATTEHFDREELQRFVAFWCIGHLTGSVQAQRTALAGGHASA